jgi:8-oxo-dGTP pyrophosphatase MutT (NUDIX family)
MEASVLIDAQPGLLIAPTASSIASLSARSDALALLAAYAPRDSGERAAKARILDFIDKNEELGRPNPAGHLTASALVVDAAFGRLLLNHHAKLGIWVQFGGHVEEGECVAEAALRETREESGLASVRLLSPAIFDIDIHPIPARGEVAAHYHYDLRFLAVADPGEAFAVSAESISLRWIALDELSGYSSSESMLRMGRKVEALRSPAATAAPG